MVVNIFVDLSIVNNSLANFGISLREYAGYEKITAQRSPYEA